MKIAIVATSLLLATAIPATAGHYGGDGGTNWGAVVGAGIHRGSRHSPHHSATAARCSSRDARPHPRRRRPAPCRPGSPMRQGIGPSRSSRAISEACRVAGTDSAAADRAAAVEPRSNEARRSVLALRREAIFAGY
jgi:hypothetical protein